MNPHRRKAAVMTREQVYADMEATLGLVPTFFKNIPDPFLDLEWTMFKTTEMMEGDLPAKYRELIGLGIAAATHCRYCTFHHMQMAQLHGARVEEIEEALRFAKHTTGWSTYMNGEEFDFDDFKKEHLKMIEFVQAHQQQALHT